ncbi:MAG: hypothetical protein HYZ25_15570 [Chloroflexi bacterium]|nr:hypothetical protein [Chloroflexota bacterium]
MTTGQIWQPVLAHLQSDLPRAAFETWVRDTQALSLEGGLLTVRAQNAYARDWLEARLTAPIQDWLNDHLERAVTVRFVSGAETEEPEEEEPQLSVEPVAWLDYDRIVQPHRQVVVKGYLRRLGREIGPKAIWLYIGFHQAAWRRQDQKGNEGQPLHSREVLRFSALSHGAF